jgi:hypothetical protein
VIPLLVASLLLGPIKFTARPSKPDDDVKITVKPSKTDAEIDTFDSPHTIFEDTKAKPRHELLLFLPGTHQETAGFDAFCTLAADLGYQVINLMYPDSIAADVVSRDKEPNAFLNFRLTIIEGKPLSKFVHVNRANSIENRLIKLLKYLDKLRPANHWDRYLDKDGEPEWRYIAVSGLSQGCGNAALLAIRHRVARAVLFGGPKDYSAALEKPAAWYTKPETPLKLFYAFNNDRDHQGCTYPQQLENLRTIGLDKLGKPVNVDSFRPPLGQSHILITDYPGKTVNSDRAHTSVVTDKTSPIGGDGGRLFGRVWKYMLTGEVDLPAGHRGASGRK